MAALCSMSLILSEFSLNLLCSFQKLTGGKSGLAQDDAIEKLILRLKAPGFRFYQ